MLIIHKKYKFLLTIYITINIDNILSININNNILSNEYNNNLSKSDNKNRKKYCKYVKGYINKISIESRESLESDKKILRYGTIIKRKDAKANILIAHGFGSNSKDSNFINMIFEKYNTLIFDFRAHGNNNEDQCCTFGRNEIYDIIAAVNYIKNDIEIKDIPIIGYGFSMGAVSLILAQAQDNSLFKGLILDCPFESSDKLIQRSIKNINSIFINNKLLNLYENFIIKIFYNYYGQKFIKLFLKNISNIDISHINNYLSPIYPKEAIKFVEVPCFFITSANDEKAPFESVMEIYENLNNFKRFWITKGEKHFDSIFFKTFEYRHRTNKFIDNIIENKIVKKAKNKIIDFNGKKWEE